MNLKLGTLNRGGAAIATGFRGRGRPDFRRAPVTRINERIRVPQVRVVAEDGEEFGVMDTRDAIRSAREKGMDLVEVAPTARHASGVRSGVPSRGSPSVSSRRSHGSTMGETRARAAARSVVTKRWNDAAWCAHGSGKYSVSVSAASQRRLRLVVEVPAVTETGRRAWSVGAAAGRGNGRRQNPHQ